MSVVDDAVGANAGMGQIWSTHSLPEAEQFSAWAHVCQDAFCPVTVARDAEGPFDSRVAGRQIGPVGVSEIHSEPQSVTRTAAHVAGRADDLFFLNLPLSPGSFARQDGRTAPLSPGDFAIVDSSQTFELGFERRFRQVSLALPHELLAARLGDVRGATAVRVAGDRGVGAVASAALRSLPATGPVDRAGARQLTESLCDLIALALGPAAAAKPRCTSRALLTQAAFDEVERRLSDPELAPGDVAQRLAVSSRYLHSLFAGRGTSFGRWLLQRRLDHCRVALSDPRQAHRTIADIAFSHGFSDPSYFTRVFRARYGLSPRELRASVAARRSPAAIV